MRAIARVAAGSAFIVRAPIIGGESLDAAPPSPAAAGELSGLKVLVVDDNQDAADVLGQLLSMYGADVQISCLAEAALELVGAFDPALVLLDIGLPDLDGYEACRRMRQLKGGRVKLVALTGLGRDDDRQRASDAGFDEHMTKPVDFDRLGAIAARCRNDVNAALASKRMTR